MSKRPPTTDKGSVWYQRSRIGMLIGSLLLGIALLLRWKMGNAAVEASSLYWLHPAGMVVMIIATFVNLWTHPTDMFELKPKHDEKDITKE